MLVKLRRDWITHKLLVGMYADTAILEKQLFQKEVGEREMRVSGETQQEGSLRGGGCSVSWLGRYPACDTVLQFYKMLPSGETG